MRWQNRLHHAELGWLPAPSSGIATHVVRAIHATGLAPAGLQHCRLLHRLNTRFPGFVAKIKHIPAKVPAQDTKREIFPD